MRVESVKWSMVLVYRFVLKMERYDHLNEYTERLLFE